ncbi:MAG TPA: glycosyltransferase family 9 protein [Pirellulales bacterium]|nr:glycosyltransferase family 9 protein [Pirellulales bacterium]
MKRSFERARRAARTGPRHGQPAGRYRYVRIRWRLLFAAVDSVGRRLWRIGRAIGAAWPGDSNEHGHDPRSILLVQLDHLGDAVLSASVLPALRRRFPRARIEVLAAPWNREVFAACPEVDRLHVSRLNRFTRGFRLGWIAATFWWGWKLRRERFDLAIDVRGEFPLALILWLTGARRRLGWDCGGGGFLLTDRARYEPGRPEVESRLALLAEVGVEPDPDLLRREPWFDAGHDARRCVDDLLDGLGERSQPLYLLHIGAGTRAKRWQADRWRELLGRLIVEHNAQVVLIGAGEERAWAAAITGGLAWPGVHDWTGRLSLVETAALIERADVFVGADSGPAHLAAAVGTPAVVLFSGTNRVEQWRPWGRRVVVLKHEVACSPCHRQTCPWMEHPCMSRLTALSVSRAIHALRAAILGTPPAGLGDLDRAADPPGVEVVTPSSPPSARKSG